MLAVKAILATLTSATPDLTFVVGRVAAGEKESALPVGFVMQAMILFWQALPFDHPDIVTAWGVSSFQPSSAIYLLVFLVKLPIIVADGLIGVLIVRIVKSLGGTESQCRFGALAWLGNPYVTLLGEMWASFDMLVTLSLVFGLWLILARRPTFSALALALGTITKFSPILLVPLISMERHKSKIRLLSFAGIALLGAALYFVIVQWAGFDPFLALTRYHPLLYNYDELVLSTVEKERVGLTTIFLIAAYAGILRTWTAGERSALYGASVVLLTYLGLTNWFPPYTLWVVPFLTVDMALERSQWKPFTLLLLTAFIFSVIHFEVYFSANDAGLFFFPPMGDTMRAWVRTYREAMRSDLSLLIALPASRAFFVSVALYYVWKAFVDNSLGLRRILSGAIGSASSSRV